MQFHLPIIPVSVLMTIRKYMWPVMPLSLSFSLSLKYLTAQQLWHTHEPWISWGSVNRQSVSQQIQSSLPKRHLKKQTGTNILFKFRLTHLVSCQLLAFLSWTNFEKVTHPTYKKPIGTKDYKKNVPTASTTRKADSNSEKNTHGTSMSLTQAPEWGRQVRRDLLIGTVRCTRVWKFH